MGLKLDELLNMTWSEYDYYSTGHFRRIERMWDISRHEMATMYNSSGFSKKKVKPKDIMKLPILDKPRPIKKIDTSTVNRLLNLLRDGHN